MDPYATLLTDIAAEQSKILHEGGSTAPRFLVTASATEEQAHAYAASGYTVSPIPGASARFLDAVGAISLLGHGDREKVDVRHWTKVATDVLYAYEDDLANRAAEIDALRDRVVAAEGARDEERIEKVRAISALVVARANLAAEREVLAAAEREIVRLAQIYDAPTSNGEEK